MRSAALRWTTFGLFVAVLVSAGVVLWRAESASRIAADSIHTFDIRAASLTRPIMELRMAQQAYVAAGQGDGFWGSKVASQIASLRTDLADVRALAASPDARGALDEAVDALGDFERLDARALEYARGHQRLLASDLIFSDGMDKTGAMLDAVERARTLESEAGGTLLRSQRTRQLGALGAAAAAALLLALVLLPVPRARTVEDAAVAQPTPAVEEAWPLRDARDPVPPLPVEPPPSLRDAEPEPRDVFDLGKIASLCSDLARATDTRSLPALLERTASVLDASGVVLWIADPDGRELNPIVTHGYPPQLVTRLGTIPREAQNATAAAFRTALLQTVHGDAVSNGAIAVPLVTPVGCVGVVAAEVNHGGEREDAKLAAAAIVAAQLATIVGPPSARSQSRPEAARA